MADEPAKIIPDDAAISPSGRTPDSEWLRRQKHQPLAFSYCENCGTELSGHFCYACGQAALDYHRSFGHVLLEALDEFINWDSRFFSTIALLIVKPWRLTIDFLEGKRVRHAHPLRLYLYASIAFFFAVNYGAKDLKDFELGKISDEARDKVAAAVTEKRDEIEKELDQDNLTPEQRKKAEEVLDNLANPAPSPSVSVRVPSPAPNATASATPPATATGSPGGPKQRQYGAVGDRPFLVFDEEESSLTPWQRWLEEKAKEKIGEHGTKWGLFITTLFSYLPYMMLCCVPLFAFVLKVLYTRRRIFYIDHLIYALHIHTFFYTGIMLIVLATMGLNRTIPGTFAGWIIAALWITFVVQIFLSIRYVYRQGWFRSTLKFFVGGFIYLFVLLLAFAATFFITLAIPT